MKKLLLVAFLASSLMSLQSCGGDDSVVPNGGNNNNGGGGNNGGGNNGGGNNGGGNNGGGNNGGGNNGGGGNTTTANLPIFIDGDLNGDTTIEYDSKDRFSKITVEKNNSNVSITEFKYDNDVLSEIKKSSGTLSNPVTEYHTFTYSNNRVRININGKDDFEISIDNQGLALQTALISMNPPYITSYLYDSNKNVISSIAPSYKQDMTYDNANGIFKNVNMPQWAVFYTLTTSVNLISLPVCIFNNLTEISYVSDPYVFQYTYNSDNYPITFYSTYYGQKADITYSK